MKKISKKKIKQKPEKDQRKKEVPDKSAKKENQQKKAAGRLKKEKSPKISRAFLSRAVLFVIGGGAVALLFSLGNLLVPREEEILAPPLRVPEKVEYKTHEVYYDSLVKKITNRGFFTSENQVDLSFSNRDGYLRKIYIRVGDPVKKGDLLAVLDTDMITNDIQIQKVLMEAAQNMLVILENRSQADLDISRMQYEELKRDFDAKKQLQNTISRVELDKLENQVKIQEQMLSMKEYDYSSQILSAEKDIELAKLQLKVLELELKKSRMTASVNGIAEYVAYVNEGEYIPAYKKIVTISDPYKLILQYKGSDYHQYYLGMQVNIKIDDKIHSGEVVMIPSSVPAEEFEKMKETIQIRVNDLPRDIERGKSAVIEAVLDWADNVLVLPKRLVHKYSGRWFVKILEDGIVNQRDVQIGIESASSYEILGGLEAGELVVE